MASFATALPQCAVHLWTWDMTDESSALVDNELTQPAPIAARKPASTIDTLGPENHTVEPATEKASGRRSEAFANPVACSLDSTIVQAIAVGVHTMANPKAEDQTCAKGINGPLAASVSHATHA
ncbi:MAG: hypothetical protein KDC98_17250 [Planctomycetes bacterium]|nr:hypothetical protein [Planctomycetota bacterium]